MADIIPTKQNTGIILRTTDELKDFARIVAASGIAPKGLEKPETIFVTLAMGAELGFSPMQSLQNIAVVNGKPSIYGDAALALVWNSGLCEDYKQNMLGTGEETAAVVSVKRKGMAPISASFSVRDAKRAGLWGKGGPWTQYPERMLMFRARGFALRDAFPDVLRGLKTTEEISDYPSEVDTQPQDTPINTLRKLAAAKKFDSQPKLETPDETST